MTEAQLTGVEVWLRLPHVLTPRLPHHNLDSDQVPKELGPARSFWGILCISVTSRSNLLLGTTGPRDAIKLISEVIGGF